MPLLPPLMTATLPSSLPSEAIKLALPFR